VTALSDIWTSCLAFLSWLSTLHARISCRLNTLSITSEVPQFINVNDCFHSISQYFSLHHSISEYSLLSVLRLLLILSNCSFAALRHLRWRIAFGVSLHPDIVSRLEIVQRP
jgi:hypothetical protein